MVVQPKLESSCSELVGAWQYGKKPYEYFIVRDTSGELRFVERKKSGTLSGVLHPQGHWLQGDLYRYPSGDDQVVTIRLLFSQDDDTIVSNVRGLGKMEWGKDKVARRCPRIAHPEFCLGSHGICRMPSFMPSSGSEATAEVIREFTMLNMGSPVITEITGGRLEVFLTGVGSEPFREFAQQHCRSEKVLSFLDSLKDKLSDVAFANGGELSTDIVALVGASEMQVPHLDLKQGQVQVITALTNTAPTLVYDPAANKPSAEQVLESIGVSLEHRKAPHLRYILNGGAPLVLPVSELYEHMVPACAEFHPGDAVQIRDGIVHAGPKCVDRPGMLPRIVVFATYSTLSTEHYNVELQYKFWDWALFSKVPAHVAYKELLDAHFAPKQKGITVQPWVHFSGENAKACRTLCTTPGLEMDEVEELVRIWRHGLHRPVSHPCDAAGA